MLTALAAVLPPRIAHAIARWFGFDNALSLFCPHCPSWGDWPEIEEEAA